MAAQVSKETVNSIDTSLFPESKLVIKAVNSLGCIHLEQGESLLAIVHLEEEHM